MKQVVWLNTKAICGKIPTLACCHNLFYAKVGILPHIALAFNHTTCFISFQRITRSLLHVFKLITF